MDALRRPLALSAAAILFFAPVLCAQNQEKSIVDKLHRLRSLPDHQRWEETRRLAIAIRQLPAGGGKAGVDHKPANRATQRGARPATSPEGPPPPAHGLKKSPPHKDHHPEPHKHLPTL